MDNDEIFSNRNSLQMRYPYFKTSDQNHNPINHIIKNQLNRQLLSDLELNRQIQILIQEQKNKIKIQKLNENKSDSDDLKQPYQHQQTELQNNIDEQFTEFYSMKYSDLPNFVGIADNPNLQQYFQLQKSSKPNQYFDNDYQQNYKMGLQNEQLKQLNDQSSSVDRSFKNQQAQLDQFQQFMTLNRTTLVKGLQKLKQNRNIKLKFSQKPEIPQLEQIQESPLSLHVGNLANQSQHKEQTPEDQTNSKAPALRKINQKNILKDISKQRSKQDYLQQEVNNLMNSINIMRTPMSPKNNKQQIKVNRFQDIFQQTDMNNQSNDPQSTQKAESCLKNNSLLQSQRSQLSQSINPGTYKSLDLQQNQSLQQSNNQTLKSIINTDKHINIQISTQHSSQLQQNAGSNLQNKLESRRIASQIDHKESLSKINKLDFEVVNFQQLHAYIQNHELKPKHYNNQQDGRQIIENIQAKRINKKIRVIGKLVNNSDLQIIKSINMNEMIKNFKQAQIARNQFGEQKIIKDSKNQKSVQPSQITENLKKNELLIKQNQHLSKQQDNQPLKKLEADIQITDTKTGLSKHSTLGLDNKENARNSRLSTKQQKDECANTQFFTNELLEASELTDNISKINKNHNLASPKNHFRIDSQIFIQQK